MNHHYGIVIVDIQHQILQRAGGGRYPKLGRQAIDHFHFGVTGTYRAKFGEHAGNLRLVDILEALFLQRLDDLSLRAEFLFFKQRFKRFNQFFLFCRTSHKSPRLWW